MPRASGFGAARLLRAIGLVSLLISADSASAAQEVTNELAGRDTCQPGNGLAKFIAPPPTALPEVTGASPAILRKLGKRNTVNVFAPWLDTDLHPASDYGLVWHGWDKGPGGPAIWLREMYWAYFMPNRRDGFYRFHGPELENFTALEPWQHDKEYGKTFRIDYASPDYPQYAATVASRMLQGTGAEGLMLDWWIDSHPGLSKPEVRAARAAMITAIRDRVGDGPILLGNVGRERDNATVDKLNGVFMEFWKQSPAAGYSCAELALMEDLLTHYDQSLSQPKIVAFEPWRMTQKETAKDRLSPANQRMAKLFGAMAAVVPRNGYILYADNNRDNVANDHEHSRYGFYDIDLGQATSGRTEIAPGLGYKRFEKGVAIYNISPEAAEISFGGRSVQIQSIEGLFCRETKGGFDCT